MKAGFEEWRSSHFELSSIAQGTTIKIDLEGICYASNSSYPIMLYYRIIDEC